MKPAPILVLPLLAALSSAGCAPAPATSSPPPGAAATADSVEVVGTFHIIWGERPNYFVTDDGGRTHRLEMDPALAQPYGGPTGLDRRRVVVRGIPRAGDSDVILVQSVDPVPEAG